MRRAFLLCMVLAGAPFPGFAQRMASAPLSGKPLITGSSTMAPMVVELGKRFRTRHPGVVITVEAGGSGRGVADALDGKAAQQGLPLKSLALDGIALGSGSMR